MEDFAGQILILSGPPGAGKTTAADALTRLPGAPKVHLHSDDFWAFIKQGCIAPWLPEADRQNRMIMQIAATMAAGYARGGYGVVLDGVVGPWALPPFAALDLPVHYLVLRTGLEEAVARCRERGGDSLSDPAVISDLHGQFADLAAHEHHALTVSGLDRAATLSAIGIALRSGAYRL